jgi:hypothetical protein
MRRAAFGSVAAVALLALAGAAVRGQSDARKGALAADKGKLRMLLDGQAVGTEEFSISASGAEWTTRGEARIQMPGGAAQTITGRLRLAPDAAPLSYEWSTQAEKKNSGSMTFQGGQARVELNIEGTKPFAIDKQFPGRVVILDNNMYHHYAILGRLYDWQRKGEQSFPVYIPQDDTPGEVVVKSEGSVEIDGKKFDLLRMRTADLELQLFFDKQRLMRLTAPGGRVVIERE